MSFNADLNKELRKLFFPENLINQINHEILKTQELPNQQPLNTLG